MSASLNNIFPDSLEPPRKSQRPALVKADSALSSEEQERQLLAEMDKSSARFWAITEAGEGQIAAYDDAAVGELRDEVADLFRDVDL